MSNHSLIDLPGNIYESVLELSAVCSKCGRTSNVPGEFMVMLNHDDAVATLLCTSVEACEERGGYDDPGLD